MLGFLPTRAYRPGTPGATTFLSPLSGTFNYGWDSFRWLAYTSTETGSTEVFVRPFPDVDSGRWQVSTAGGMMPEWAHSGRELFFVDGSRALVAAQVETDSGFQVGEKETLFTLPPGY